MSEPTSPGRPDPERTTWVGRAKPPAQPPPPTDPYWPPVEGTAPQYVEYPHGYPAAMVRPPRPRRHGARNILITLLGIFGLCCVGGVALAISLNGGWTGTSALGPAPPGLNTPVTDGKFTFVVTSVNCGQPTVGRLVTRTAKGTFCLVKLTVENTGTEAQSFSDVFQKVLGPDGTSYDADNAAGVLVNENLTGLWSHIQPGGKITATVVYDVPKDTRIAKVELHDSLLSTGTLVTL